jgi:hypothetical protein
LFNFPGSEISSSGIEMAIESQKEGVKVMFGIMVSKST